MTRVLLTGATGFVGGNVLRRILDHTDWHVVAPHRPLTHWVHPVSDRLETVPVDMSTVDPVWAHNILGPVDVVMNLASDTDIPRAIREPARSLEINTRLMSTVLEYARKACSKLFLHMSTNEVYGAGTEPHREWDPIRPDNPYAAGKAAQEAMAHAWWRTYRVPVVITNTMNPFGPGQPAGKFVPVCLDRIADGGVVPIQADAQGRPASRQYIHAANLADAWIFLARRYLDAGPPPFPLIDRPERFNIAGHVSIDNVAMFHALKAATRSVVVDFESLPVSDYILNPGAQARPGRDVHHALDTTRMEALGWRPPLGFREALEDTVRHHLAMREDL